MPPVSARAVAFDRAASSRVFDEDGHLHVKRTRISKACVNEYLGSEIPGWEALGLDRDRRYALLRDPEELAAAVGTFNNKPLLFIHKPVTAEAHDHSITVGTVSNPEYEAPYLYADLAAWDGVAIEAIQDGSQKELSSAYRYEPDMTPGTFEGVHYDGVMRNIACNHVALVKKGRAGPDVVVGDSFEGIITMRKNISGAAAMTQGALAVYLRPRLAMDQSIDLAPAVEGLTRKNFGMRLPHVVLAVQKAVRGKLAKDADIEDVAEVVEALKDVLPDDLAAAVEVDPGAAAETGEDEGGSLRDKLLAAGLTEEEADEVVAKRGAAAPAADEDKGKGGEGGKPKGVAQDGVSAAAFEAYKAEQDRKARAAKVAQDAALQAQGEEIAARFRGVDDARRFVRPFVGELAMSFDSAETVHRAALDVLKVKHAGIDASALPTLIELAGKPADKRAAPAPIAQDAAAAESFAKRFGTDRIRAA